MEDPSIEKEGDPHLTENSSISSTEPGQPVVRTRLVSVRSPTQQHILIDIPVNDPNNVCIYV